MVLNGSSGLRSAPYAVPCLASFPFLPMTPRPFSQRSWWRVLLIFLLLLGVVLWRAQPAFFRGTYATEGGEWLSQLWQGGFWQAMQVRPDYWVTGNILVIQLADWLTRAIGGHALAACGPALQHGVAGVYVTVLFLSVCLSLRRHHGWIWAVAVTLFMLVMPDLDDENRIFGEANNVGYFSALTVLFVYYDCWLAETMSTRRLAWAMLWVTFHLLTSPMAALVSGGCGALLLLRAAFRKGALSKPAWALHLAVVALAAAIVIYAKLHSMYEPEGAEVVATGVTGTTLGERFVELVLGRQVLFPITAAWHLGSSDRGTLVLLMLWLGGVVLVVRSRWAGVEARRELTGWLLLALVGMGMAVATLLSRKYILNSGKPYQTLWPARYYLAQTMIFAAFLALGLRQLAVRWPAFRASAGWILCVLGALCLGPQREHLQLCLTQDSPRLAARYWDAQLTRAVAVQELVGDAAVARQPGRAAVDYTAEMFIDRHVVQVPLRMVAGVVPSKTLCPIALVPAEQLHLRENAPKAEFSMPQVQIIPRAQGVLVSVEVELLNIAYFAESRRKLWVSGLPGQPQSQAFAYHLENTTVQRKDGKANVNWLLQADFFYPHPVHLAKLQGALEKLTLALGDEPGSCLAITHTTSQPSFSSLLGDDSFDARLYPTPTVFRWEPGPGSVKLRGQNLRVQGGSLTLEETGPFDEAAYLEQNADVAAAVRQQQVASGLAHYTAFGKAEGRPCCHRAITLDLPAGVDAAQLDSVQITLALPKKGAPPQRLIATLHGPAGETLRLPLTLAAGESTYRASHLQAVLGAAAFPLRQLAVEFHGVSGHMVTVKRIELR